MKNTATPRSGIETPGRGPLITKGILLLVFLAGLGVIFLGVTGMRAYEASGFSSENAYSAIHALGGSTAEAWRKLDGQLGGLTAGQRSQADQAAESLLLSNLQASCRCPQPHHAAGRRRRRIRCPSAQRGETDDRRMAYRFCPFDFYAR